MKLLDKQHQLNIDHLRNPSPGDYWESMLFPYFVILKSDGNKIIICEHTKEFSDQTWEWDLKEARTVNREYLRKRLLPLDYKGKFRANVRPYEHEIFVKQFNIMEKK